MDITKAQELVHHILSFLDIPSTKKKWKTKYFHYESLCSHSKSIGSHLLSFCKSQIANSPQENCSNFITDSESAINYFPYFLNFLDPLHGILENQFPNQITHQKCIFSLLFSFLLYSICMDPQLKFYFHSHEFEKIQTELNISITLCKTFLQQDQWFFHVHILSLHRLGLYYQMVQQDQQNALALYEQIIVDLDPKYTLVYYNRAILFSAMQEHQRALEDYNTSIRLFPTYVPALYNRAYNLANFFRGFKQAANDYSKVIKLEPQRSDAYINRGLLFVNCFSNIRLAIQDFSKAICLEPQILSHYEMRGRALLAQNSLHNALRDFNFILQHTEYTFHQKVYLNKFILNSGRPITQQMQDLGTKAFCSAQLTRIKIHLCLDNTEQAWKELMLVYEKIGHGEHTSADRLALVFLFETSLRSTVCKLGEFYLLNKYRLTSIPHHSFPSFFTVQQDALASFDQFL